MSQYKIITLETCVNHLNFLHLKELDCYFEITMKSCEYKNLFYHPFNLDRQLPEATFKIAIRK